MRQLLPPGTILCLPTTPFPAPLAASRSGARAAARPHHVPVAHGGLTGVPQVSLPGAQVDGLPVGLSIVGRRGSDAALVAVAQGDGGSGR